MKQTNLFFFLALCAFGSLLATPQQDLEQAVKNNDIDAASRIIATQRQAKPKEEWLAFILPSFCLAAKLGQVDILVQCLPLNAKMPLYSNYRDDIPQLLAAAICRDDHPEIFGLLSQKSEKLLRSLLQWAVWNAKLPYVMFLVERNVSTKGRKRSFAFLAAERGALGVLKYLIEQKPVLRNQEALGNYTLLHAAADAGKLSVVRFLVEECQFSTNRQNDSGKTPLHLAASKGQVETVQYLLTKKGRANIQDRRGKIPLNLASNKKIRKLLTDHIQRLTNQDEPSKNVASAPAPETGSELGGLAVLAEAAGQLGAQSDRGQQNEAEEAEPAPAPEQAAVENVQALKSQFLEAIKSGDVERVRALIRQGASVNADPDDVFYHPLGEAAQNNQRAVVRILIDAGASVNDSWFRKHSLHSVFTKDYFEMINLLVEYGLDLTHYFSRRWNPYTKAASNNNLALIRYLFENGLSLDTITNIETMAHVAAKKGNPDILHFVLENKRALAYQRLDGRVGYTPIHYAAIAGHLNCVKMLIEHPRADSGSINSISLQFLYTPLMLAAKYGHKSVVEYLIQKGANLSLKDQRDKTALQFAEEADNQHIAEVLRNAEARQTYADQAIELPQEPAGPAVALPDIHPEDIGLSLSGIAQEESCDRAGFLTDSLAEGLRFPELGLGDISEIRSQANGPLQPADNLAHGILPSEDRGSGGASHQNKSNGRGQTHVQEAHQPAEKLIDAANKGDFDTVQRILNEDADVNYRTAFQSTPLIEASSGGDLRIVRLLLDRGAEVNAKDFFQRTALGKALENGHLEIARLLIENGARVDQDKESDMQSPLYVAAQKNNFQAVKLLVRSRAKTDMDFGEYSPLNAAVENGNFPMVQYLVEVGVPLHVDSHYKSSAFVAAEKGHLEIAQYLIGKQPELAYQRFNGHYTPLHVAAMRGFAPLVSYLCTCAQVKVDCKELNGQTPLHLAVTHGHIDVVRALLKAGVDISIKTKRGETAKILAQKNDHNGIVNLLVGFARKRLRSAQPVESVSSPPADADAHDPKAVMKEGIRRSARLRSCGKKSYREISSDDGDSDTDSSVGELQSSKRRAVRDYYQKAVKRAKRAYTDAPQHAATRAGHDRGDTQTAEDDAVLSASKSIARRMHKESTHLLLEVSKITQQAQAPSDEHVGYPPTCVDQAGREDEQSHSARLQENVENNQESERALLQAVATLADDVIARGSHEKRKADDFEHDPGPERPLKKAKSVTDSDEHSAAESSMEEELIAACEAGDVQKVRQYLERDLGVLHAKYTQGVPLMHMLAYSGHKEALVFLFEKYGDDHVVRACTPGGATVLHYAAMGGNLDIVMYLVDRGLSITDMTDKGVTPFMCAVREGHEKIVNYFLQKMNDAEKKVVVNQATYLGRLPLIVAAKHGYDKIVALLLAHGALVDAYDRNGQTALFLAVRKVLQRNAQTDYVPLMRVLLAHGARPDQMMAHGQTVAEYAREHGSHNREVMQVLTCDG